MARLSITVVATALAVLVLAASGAKELDKGQVYTFQLQSEQTNDVLKWFCDHSPFASSLPSCQSTTTTKAPTTSTASTSTPGTGSTVTLTTTETSTASTTESPSVLELAHWCRFPNGSYVARGYAFMYTACQVCQCTQSRAIRCTEPSCMPTYCIDNTVPSRRSGQCCTQCAYENNSTGCEKNGVTYPHGTILKATSDKVYCWCQQGTIECRKIGISLFSGLDLWGEGTAVYIIVIVLCVLLIVGTLLCGGCSLLYYYYYYYYNQQSTEQAFWDNAGWQPMGDEEQVVDTEAEKKQAEAEQSRQDQQYPTGLSKEYVPPPYALYNGAYASEEIKHA